jgi:hypothetical protein
MKQPESVGLSRTHIDLASIHFSACFPHRKPMNERCEKWSNWAKTGQMGKFH